MFPHRLRAVRQTPFTENVDNTGEVYGKTVTVDADVVVFLRVSITVTLICTEFAVEITSVVISVPEYNFPSTVILHCDSKALYCIVALTVICNADFP